MILFNNQGFNYQNFCIYSKLTDVLHFYTIKRQLNAADLFVVVVICNMHSVIVIPGLYNNDNVTDVVTYRILPCNNNNN